MNEPYIPSEPQIGSTPAADEKSTIGTESGDPTIKIESGKTQMHRAADDLKSTPRATADAYGGKAEEALGDGRERARSFQKEIEQEVREKPTKAILTVLGIGFLRGLIFRRH
jgi:ElaB/YqjD/DUF883 family membrane-anchored ribosome-binding protein